MAGLESSPLVDGIVGYAQTGDTRFISTNGDSAYVVVQLNVSDEASVEHLDELEAAIAEPGDGIRLLLGGYGPLTRDSAEQSEKDLIRAETISLPIAAFVLMLVFGSLIARRAAAPRRRPRDPHDPRRSSTSSPR